MKKVLVITFLVIPFISGCCVGLEGIFAHTIQKNNDEYDNIIVNMGYRYRQYYQVMEERNKELIVQNKPQEKVLLFEEWLETQAKSKKEIKAVKRYKRIHLNNP